MISALHYMASHLGVYTIAKGCRTAWPGGLSRTEPLRGPGREAASEAGLPVRRPWAEWLSDVSGVMRHIFFLFERATGPVLTSVK